MKSPLSYFLISGIILLLIFTGTFIWRNNHIKEGPKFNEKSFTAPVSSKYIPTNADLVFHWKINPTLLPKYIENYQDKVNKSITNKKTKLIRDSSFKLISLDFTKDISKWAGEYGSFAVFDTNNELFDDWLMILEINKDVNTDEELEKALGQQFIDENINPSNKSNLISKKVNSNQTIYFLNERKHILISSNPEIIESSISKSKDNKLITKERYKNIKLKDNIGDGILLLELSPKKVFNLIGQEKDLLDMNQSEELISSIRIDKQELILEGILSYDIKNKRPINDPSYDLINMEKEFNLFDNVILIDNPKKYFKSHNIHPYKKLVASLIKESTEEDFSNLLKIILENNKGNLIWLKDKEWLALTSEADTDKKEISDLLGKERFSSSNIEFNNKNLQVWSKITTNNNEKFELKENIEAIIEENNETYIWSQDLFSISEFNDKKYLPNNLYSEYKIDEVNDFDDILRIHLGKEKTKLILNKFYPYILLRTMLGNKLNSPQAIDISISIPTINYPDFIKFQISLKTS